MAAYACLTKGEMVAPVTCLLFCSPVTV